MDDAQAIWAARSDDELLEASTQLFEFTEAGEGIIRAEMQRRGLPAPDPPIGKCSRCGRSIASNHPGDQCSECEEPFPSHVLRQLRGRAPKSELVLVFETADPGLVPLATSMLDDEEIEHVIRGASLQDPFGATRGGGTVEFWVRQDDAERAASVVDGLGEPPPPSAEEPEVEHRAEAADNEAAKPNPALQPLSVLIGTWNTIGTHPLVPGKTFHGRSSFAWIEGGAFLIMHSQIDEPEIPSAIAIFGTDDATGECSMLYFDERGVSRKYDVSLRDNAWTWSRDAPGFSQRFTGAIAADGRTIVGRGELSKDGSHWEPDLQLTYTRAD